MPTKPKSAIYLIAKTDFERKTARHRFAYHRHMEKLGYSIEYCGPGWETSAGGWVEQLELCLRKACAIIVYPRPSDWTSLFPINDIPTIIEYDECRDTEGVFQASTELALYQPNHAILHYYSDFQTFAPVGQTVLGAGTEIHHWPIGLDTGLFFNEQSRHRYAVGFAGAVGKLYPVRTMLVDIAAKWTDFERYKPNLRISKDSQMFNYASFLRSSRCILACSSRHKYSLAKFGEGLLSGCWIVSDLPTLSPDMPSPNLVFEDAHLILNIPSSVRLPAGTSAFKLRKPYERDGEVRENSVFLSAECYAKKMIKLIEDAWC